MGEIIKYLQSFYFELFITEGNNSDFVKCLNEIDPGTFFKSFLWITMLPLCVLFIYYIIIDHPKAKGLLKWTVLLVLISIITSFVIDGIIIEEFYYLYEFEYNDQITDVASLYNYNFIIFWFVNFTITLFVSFIISMFIKLKSKNCSKTPF